MSPARRKPKSLKRSGKRGDTKHRETKRHEIKRRETKGRKTKHRATDSGVVSPSTCDSSSPLVAFFATYSPLFEYNPSMSASSEFYRLCNESGWDKEDSERQKAHENFKDALVQQFNVYYGTDPNALGAWQALCHVVRVDSVPEDLHACREAIRYTFVNLVDLVDTRTTGVEVQVFESERALSEYTKSTGKYFPRENANAGGLLQHLLRHIYNPRNGYDTTRNWRKGKHGAPLKREFSLADIV